MARYRNPTKKNEHVAKTRLLFDPLFSGGRAVLVVDAVRMHPLLDTRDQRTAYELLKLSQIILPIVRQAAKTMPSGRPGARSSGMPMVYHAAVSAPGERAVIHPVSGPGIRS